MKKSYTYYFLCFVASLLGLMILMAIISHFISSASTSGTVLVPFLAAMITGGQFVKKEKRAPTNSERGKLTNGSFVIFLGVNILLTLLFIMAGGFQELEVGSSLNELAIIMSVLFFIVGIIAYFMMRWAYGGLLKKQVEKLRDKNDTFD